LGDAVTQITQRYQIRFQRRAGLFRRFPDWLASSRPPLLQFVIDLIHGNWLAVELEFETLRIDACFVSAATFCPRDPDLSSGLRPRLREAVSTAELSVRLVPSRA
jgi:hypothetical protein